MTYHKRPLVKRRCAHCGTKFEAAHKSRLYCCQSCNTLAWRARQPKALGATPSTGAAAPSPASLALTAHNVGMLALGNLVAQGAVAALQHLLQGDSAPAVGALPDSALVLPPGVEPPLTFLPPALARATAPVHQLAIGGLAPRPFVRLVYCGHVLYHQAAHQLLYWEQAPGRYFHLVTGRLLALLAAKPGKATLAIAPAAVVGPGPLGPVPEREPAALVAQRPATPQEEQAAEAQAEAALAQALRAVESASSSLR